MRLRSGPGRRNLFGFALGFVFLFSTFTLSQETNTAVLYLFWGEGCPHCTAEKQFLGELKGKYPALELRSFEVFNKSTNRQLFSDLVKAFGQEAKSVPTTILGDNIWIGFSESIAKDIESRVAYCLEYQACPDPTKRLSSDSLTVLEQPSATNLELPLLGTVNLTNQSLLLMTALIALVDGFNPCSLWVLSMLLAIVLYTGSRPKIFAIGLTFLLVAATLYALFIAGLFNALAFVSYLRWVQVAIALLAVTFAVINIKDYFFYQQGISLTIPDSQKPRIYKGIRNITAGGKTLPAMMGATALMALGVTLLELPCTAGLPVIWSGLVSQHDVPRAEFLLLLGVYLFVFLLDELLIFSSAVVTLKVSKLEEKQGRILKLVGGMLMLTLALVMLVKPDLMQSLIASLLVFGIALAASVLVFLIHKSMSPNAETSPKSNPKHTSHKKAHR